MPKRSPSSLLIRIDVSAEAGLQKQIYGEIRRAILEGVVEPGTRLPSSRALALDLGVSRTTTLLALDQLLAEGYLSARRGSGTYVAEELPDDLPHRAPRPGRALRPELSPPPETAGAESREAPPPRPARRPTLSRRGAALAATPAPALRAGGPPRPFRLGVPGLDLFPVRLWAQLTQRRLRRTTPAQLDYGDPAGLRALREGIADHVAQARGTRCAPEQVVVTAGAQRGLETVFRLLLDPGDVAWMEEPGFPGAWSALLSAGARIRPVRVDGEGLDFESSLRRGAAEPAESPDPREPHDRAERAGGPTRGNPAPRLAYVTPSHQFPLGVPMSLARRLALLRWAGKSRAWIVEDDYDSEFRYGARPIPCLHGLDADDRVIYVGSFAKTLFPALRLGFLIVPPDLAGRFVAARRAADAHPPTLEQAVLADFLAGGHFETHLRRMRSAYRERLEALAEAAGRFCGESLRLRPVHTGLHGVADLEGVEAEAVFREAAARGIEVMPLSAYYLGRGGRRPNALLLGFAPVRPEALARGMEQLAEAIEAVRAEAR